MGRGKRTLRRLMIAAAVVAGATGALLVGAYSALQTDWGRVRLVALANGAMSSGEDLQIRIERISGVLPANIEIHGLTVADRDGTWLRLERVDARWHPAALMRGTLEIANLDALGLALLRRPVASGDSQPVRWPELPIGIRVEHFALRDAVLEEPVVGDRVELAATGDTYIEGAERVRTTLVVQRTDGISGHARAHIAIKPRTGFVNFDVVLNEADGGLIARAMSIEGLPAVSIRVAGEGPVDAMRGRARMRAGDRISVDGEFLLDAADRPKLEVRGGARAAGLVEQPLGNLLSDDVAFDVRASLTATGISVERAELSNALAQARIAGTLDNTAADFQIGIELPRLAAFADMAGFALEGRASLQSHLRSEDLRRGFTADTQATISEALPASSPLGALLGPEVRVSGTFELDSGGREMRMSVRGADVEASSAHALADAQLDLASGAVTANARVTLPRLASFSDIAGTPLSGALEIDAQVEGTTTDPLVAFRFDSPDLALDGVVVGAVTGRLDARRHSEGVRGAADVSIDQPRIGRISLASGFATGPQDTLRLDGFTLRGRDATLGGDLVVDTSMGMVTGRLAGREIALHRWSDVAGRSLSGAADLGIEMRADGGGQVIDASAQVRALTIDLEPRRTLRVGALRASAHLSDAFGKARGIVRVDAERTAFEQLRLSQLGVAADVIDAWPRNVRLDARGDLDGPFELHASADYHAGESGEFSVEVAELKASFNQVTATLAEPARLARAGDTISLSPTVFTIADGRVSVEGRIDADRIDARIDADGLTLAALDPLITTGGIDGTLSGYARVDGTRAAPSGSLELRASDVRSGHKSLVAGVRASGRVQGEWRDGRMKLVARVAGLAPTDIEARASAPLELDATTLAVSVPADEAIDGELRWTGALGPLWDLLSPFEDRVTGSGDLSITLAGTPGAPRLSGYFRIDGGGYVNVLSGTTLTDVKLTLVGDGDKLVLENLSASDGKQGRLEASGTIEFQPARAYPTNMALTFSDFLLVARDDLILVAGGDLTLAGTLDNLLLSGEIVTGQSELLLAGTLPPDVVELDVREVNVADAARPSKKKREDVGEPAVVVLDVNLSVPGRAFVRGLGLDSEWKGDVKISGDAPSPNVAGVLQPVRGSFSLLGKRFDLEKGEIRFTGSDEVDPLLNLTAERRTSKLTALVEVTGSASRPKVKLNSRPPLPESEIASQVLFGTDSTNLSPAQSLQLASAIATYSGTGGAVGILDTTRRTLGVDVIDFKDSETDPDSTRVSVGKYITDGVYLEVEGGTAEDSRTSTTVEVEVLPDVRIEGGTTEKGGNKVGVKWRWDY